MTHMGDSIWKMFLNFLKMAAWKVCEQYHNMDLYTAWL